MLCLFGLKNKSGNSLLSVTKLKNFLANQKAFQKDCGEVLKEIFLKMFQIFKNPGWELGFGCLLRSCDCEVCASF